MEETNRIIVFENKAIRRVWHEGTWYFSVIDVIGSLTESKDPRTYWKVLKNREPQLVTNCNQLKMTASDGRNRLTDAANTEGVLRILMSVPSPRVEPFKQWLAKVGTERLEEITDPEVSFARLRDVYKAKGYPDEWIERRMQTI